jgi:hypothetical protein
MREPRPWSRGPLLRPIHSGLTTGIGQHAHRCMAHGRYGGWELAAEIPRERGDRGEPHRGRQWAAREWGEADGENGRGGGTFYRALEGAERMEWRQSPVVSAPSRRWFLKVKRGKRSGRDTELVRGKWRRRLPVAAARASEGRRRRRRWAKLGPKQKRTGRLDGPPW